MCVFISQEKTNCYYKKKRNIRKKEEITKLSDYRQFKVSTSCFINGKKIHLFSQGFSNFRGYVTKVVANLAS